MRIPGLAALRILVPTTIVLAQLWLVVGHAAPDNAATWLASAASALGGEETLRSLAAVEVSGVSVLHQREQSERPEGPWFVTFTDFTDVRNVRADVVKRIARTRGFSTPDPVDNKDWTEASTTLLVSGVGLRFQDGVLGPGETPWDLGTLPVGLGPEHMVLSARDAPDVHAEADAVLDGYPHHVVAFTYSGARVRLFLNVPSFLPKAIEITRARPYEVFWAPWGDVTQRVTFGLWTIEPGGVLYPRLWDFSSGGQPDGTVEITRVRLNPAIVAADFEIPDEARQRLIVRRRLVADAPFGNPQRPAREVVPGVVQVPGSWNVVEIKQDDGVVVLEGPLSSSYSSKAIDDVRNRFGGVPVKAVITTSDSWPHIGGLREYAARAIPIYALDLNVPILKRLFAARFESSPDALMTHPRQPALRVVAGKTVVGSGPNRLVLYPLRTASGERQMMVYWPAHHLLYTSDLFTIRDTFVFLPQQVAEATQAVAREGLQVDRAFGMHYDPLPWATVVKSGMPR
ncbi:MAG TPA: hypothetical protein VH497_03440 [Vicinamibacterales bacterium]|jgi:hypothetical protein